MKNNHFPVKEDLNLAQRARKHRNMNAVGLTALILAAVIALFCKFGVVDRLDEVSAARQAAAAAESQLSQTLRATENYNQVLTEYQSYTAASQAMAGGADPMDCLDLIESELLSKSRVSAFTVADGLISVELSGVTLQEVSGIYTRLMASGLVSGVQVYTAATSGEARDTVSAAMTILLQSEDGGEEAAS